MLSSRPPHVLVPHVFCNITWRFLVCSRHSPRFRSLRKKHVHTTCVNPKARPRHETINLSLFTKQEESKYVDFFQDQLFGYAGFGAFPCFVPEQVSSPGYGKLWRKNTCKSQPSHTPRSSPIPRSFVTG